VRELLVRSEAIDLIVGADLATQLNTWHDAETLRELVDVGVVPRPGASTSSLQGWRWYEIAMQPVDLSSTFIRDMSLSDADLKKYLPAGVIPLFLRARG
jgi:nicotinic acid mononucleotide adenylyltransferase